MRSKLPKALSDERKRMEVEEKQRQVQQLKEELHIKPAKKTNDSKARTYNLLDIKEAVQIKPSDYSKTINTKKFQFVQKPRDKVKNYTSGSPSEPSIKHKKGNWLPSKYDLV